MTGEFAFCQECREYVPFFISDKEEVWERGGVSFGIILAVARCNKCGGDIYLPEIEDLNLENLRKEYLRRLGQSRSGGRNLPKES